MGLYKKTECYNCGYMTKCKKIEMQSKKAYICEVCVKSNACSVFFYPSSHLEDGDIIKTIAWGINYLGDKIKKE